MAEDQTSVQVASLGWGVKQSFCNYVQMVGGVIAPDAGAERADDGVFTFSAAPDSALTLDAAGVPQGVGTFLGEVRFDAHGGMLKVVLADPRVEIGAAGAILTVADSAARTRRVEVAQLDLSAITPGEPGEFLIPTTLSMDGIQLLGDHYALRTPLDPVRLRLATR